MPTAKYLQDKAEWSEFTTRNVDPNRPRNLATRAREQRALVDRDRAAEAQVEEEAEAAKQLMMRDRRAQSYFFGQQRLNMQKEMHDTRLRAAEEKMASEAEMLPLRKNEFLARERSAVALERARTQASDFKARMDEQEHNDTTGFTDFILRSGVRRGTPEFASAVAEARMKFPAVPTALFDDAWKMTGSSRTPEEVQASIAAARAANPNATITATERGTTITDRPSNSPVSNPELSALKKKLGEAEANQATAEPTEQPNYEPGLKALRDKITSLEGASAAPASLPSLTDRSQFDALPSGAEYIRDGRRYRKP